jgi:SAM-dependent methyltransferase
MTVSIKAQERNETLKALIRRTKIDSTYLYSSDDLAEIKIQFLAQNCEKVLDVGKSSRQRFAYFKPGQALTLDINQFEGYPDIVDDLCDLETDLREQFDGIVCLAVLEHVYNPQAAADNLYAMLKPGGYCFAYVPFLYRYHAPTDLNYQDFFRYSRDGVAYLFRDFSEVTLYPSRGSYSTIFNLVGFWKDKIESRFGQGLNRWIDRAGNLIHKRSNELQASGYFAWVIK